MTCYRRPRAVKGARLNGVFTNSFYSNHIRGRPSVAASVPILVYIALVTCTSMKKQGQ